ncbi:TPA: restriction endonuclease subunit S [Enterococcus faecium]
MSNDTLPEIRFPEFTDEWEQRKLGDESDVRDGTHDSPKYYDKGYPLVTSKNLKDFGLDLSNVSFISDEDFEVINKRSKVDIGDILFGMIGTIGNPVLVDRADFAIKNVALIKEQKKILNSFLIQILKSPVFDKYIKNENAGGTQKFLSLSKVRDFNFLCPNIDEQNCISAFFKKLDDTIALHQRKLDLLKETKKGFLQKMFPKNGAKVPEIRFPGFTEDWEQRKAKELFIPKAEKNQPELPVLSVTQDHGVVYREQVGIDIKYDKATLKNYKVIHQGDFVISLRSFQGGFELSDKLGITSPAYTIFVPKNMDSQDNLFWKTKFKTFTFIESLKTVTFGIRDGKSISFSEFGDLKLFFPKNIEEQQKIGNFFKQLDDTITLHQRKLDLLKETKKGFLQKMFV